MTLALLFPGQGSQAVGMGAALADATERERRARAAHRAVWERFLLFRAVERWLEELAALAGASKTAVP